MDVGRKTGLLAMAAGFCLLGTVQSGAWAQQAASPQTPPTVLPQAAASTTPAAAQQFPSQLTDTPVAPPNTEAMRLAGIAKDNSRGFGSSPDDGGPLARDLSPAITPEAVSAAMRKVADSELAGSQQYFTVVDRARNMDGRIWTWSVLYAGYMAAADALNEARYRDAMEQVGKSYNWGLRTTQMPSGDPGGAGRNSGRTAPGDGNTAEDYMVVVRCAVHGTAGVVADVCGDRRQEVHCVSG